MARASSTAENQGLDALASGTTNVIAYVSLHTGDPGTTGANEMASCPRQAMTWNAAASGAKTNSGTASFTNPGTSAATYFGTWSASTGGTYGIGGALTSSVTAATITVAAGALSLGLS